MTRFETTRFIFDKIRSQVSADRNRLNDETLGVTLDMTYITDNIIAMGIPSSGIDGIYRNHIKDVEAYLKTNHTNNFMIWNLSEKEYNEQKFDNQVIHLEFPDHHPPPLELLFKLILSIDNWLAADPNHVAVVHCVGGKGRTGTVIVCYLFFSGICKSVKEAQELFARKRSSSAKGVTQPSQKRYTEYFKTLFLEDRLINYQPIHLLQVALTPMPPNQIFGLEIFDSVNNGKLIYHGWHPPLMENDFPVIKFKINTDVRGDLYCRVVRQKSNSKKVSKEWHVVLHTYFVDTVQIEIKKRDLDTLPKDNAYSDDLTMTFTFGMPRGQAPLFDRDDYIERLVEDWRGKQGDKTRRKAQALDFVDNPMTGEGAKIMHPLRFSGYMEIKQQQNSKAGAAAAAAKKVAAPAPAVWRTGGPPTATLARNYTTGAASPGPVRAVAKGTAPLSNSDIMSEKSSAYTEPPAKRRTKSDPKQAVPHEQLNSPGTTGFRRSGGPTTNLEASMHEAAKSSPAYATPPNSAASTTSSPPISSPPISSPTTPGVSPNTSFNNFSQLMSYAQPPGSPAVPPAASTPPAGAPTGEDILKKLLAMAPPPQSINLSMLGFLKSPAKQATSPVQPKPSPATDYSAPPQ